MEIADVSIEESAKRMIENSPVVYGWVFVYNKMRSPVRTADSFVPKGTWLSVCNRYPAINDRAILACSVGTKRKTGRLPAMSAKPETVYMAFRILDADKDVRSVSVAEGEKYITNVADILPAFHLKKSAKRTIESSPVVYVTLWS